jgi:hypothetical protein
MSNLQRAPLVNGQLVERQRKASALFYRGDIVRARTGFERIVGLGLLAGSGAGNYLAFNQGAFAPFDVVALGAAVVALLFLTALQWFYRPPVPADAFVFMKVVHWCAGLNWRYCASVVVGVGLTAYGAQTIMLPIFARVLAPLVATDLLILSTWVLLIVVSLVIEVIPENILVD